MIHKCDCQNEYQDKAYGPGNRVMNPTAKEKTYRCTVCLKTHTVGGGSGEKK